MRTTNGSGSFELDERPKALRYRDQTAAVEQMIVDALPEIVGKLIAMAKDGDVAASRYLVDRIYGRVARVSTPPSLDKSLPYNHQDLSLDKLRWKDRHDSQAQIYIRDITARNYDAMPGIKSPDDTNPSLEEIRRRISRQKGS